MRTACESISVLRIRILSIFSLSFYAEMQRREPPEVQTADSGTRVEIEPARLEYTPAKKFNSVLSNLILAI